MDPQLPFNAVFWSDRLRQACKEAKITPKTAGFRKCKVIT